jgi:hypothetical protein
VLASLSIAVGVERFLSSRSNKENYFLFLSVVRQMSKTWLNLIVLCFLIIAIFGLAATGWYLRGQGDLALGEYGTYVKGLYAQINQGELNWFKGYDNIEGVFLSSGFCFGIALTLFVWSMSIALTKERKEDLV